DNARPEAVTNLQKSLIISEIAQKEGLEPDQAGDLDAGSTDNCGIDTMFITPNQFDCDQAVGMNPNVVLTARDESGNESTCTTFVRIENLEPSPTATSGLCGNDTLFLQANPPPADGGTVYTYQWFGPNGFSSTRANPVIPNIGAINAGSYSVQITGLTGCRSIGSVEVTIEDLPQTPDLLSEDDYCVNNIVTLESSITPQGVQVVYQWYRVDGGPGTLLAETLVPSYSFQAPSTPGTEEYFLIVEADGCISQPSLPKVIIFNDFPTAVPLDTNITICSGETVTLGTLVTGFGLSYDWTGPDGYEEEGAFPAIIRNATTANDGVYSLIITRNGCASAPAFVRVNVLPRPERPMLSNNGPLCQGDNLLLSTNATASIYTWVAPDLTEFSTTSNSFSLNNVDPSLGGNWRLFVTDFNCDSELSAVSNVVINDLPNAVAAASPDIICEGNDIFLNASPNIANATYSWTGPDGFMGVGRNVSIENIRPSKTGQYSVNITTDAGCSQSANVMVNVRNSVQIVSAANNGAACLSGPTDISFNAAVFPEDDGSYVYSWTGPNGFSSNIRQAIIPNATSNNNGNYQLVVTNAEGCVSDPAISIVDVSDPPATPEQPIVSEFTPAPFCVGTELELRVGDYNGNSVSYHWQTPNDGIIITNEPALNIASLDIDDSGDYSVFVNIDGCNSNPSSNLRISVNDIPSASIQTNSPICEGDPITLVANFVAGASYSWVGPNFSSALQNPTISESDSSLHAGSYQLIIERDGCASLPVNTNIVINSTPTQPQLLGSGPICADDTSAILRINLGQGSMTSGARYIWTGPNGVIDTSDNPTIDIRDFNGFADGENLFTATALLGMCPSLPSAPFRGQINQVPEITAFAGQDFTICETEDIFLSAESPAIGTGRWMYLGDDTTGNIVISNPIMSTTSVNGLGGNQSFDFAWILSNGACENYSSDQVQVSVNKVEDAFGGEDLIACAGTAVTLNATAVDGNSFWTQPEAQSLFGVRITDPTSPVTSITGLQPGNLYTFTWNVQGSCGDERDDVFILVSDPNPFAGADIVACNDEGFAELMADEPTDGSIGTWSALNSNVVISADQSPNTVVTNLEPGSYQFVWEVDNGTCGDASRDTVNVDFKINPVVNPEAFAVGFGNPIQIDLLSNDILPANSTIEIISGPDHATLEDLGNGVYRFQPSFSYVGPDRILYEVCSDACECVMGEATFTIGRDATCEIPSIITPNNDGVNDQFIVPCLFDQGAFPNSQLVIFTRWGDEVFRSGTPYNNDWDGTFNGEVLPVGTYFYRLDYGDGESPVSSFFMIQR
ncbi:MAG: gliding motility-associated C-terminal domain-containing protein, partial [Bacteroidota bacterium]